MVEQLEKVDPGKMTQDEKLAFWINVYNALMMHAYLAYGIPRNRLKRLSLLQKAAYKVGLYSISAQTIEHSILGFRSNRPAQWLQALLNPGTKFKSGDERWAYALQTPEPSVCFALCCGGCSDPAVIIPITHSHSQFQAFEFIIKRSNKNNHIYLYVIVHPLSLSLSLSWAKRLP
jgi:hypothetical protein